MATYNDLFESEIRKKVTERIHGVAQDMITGNLSDFVAYKELSGFIRGLEMIDTLCNEVRSDMEKR